MPTTDYHAVVEQLADPATRLEARRILKEAGPAAVDAAREGLSHPHWEVRRWCAAYLDHNADARALQRLTLTLEDPKAKVRRWAVHSIACEPCKIGENPVDVDPLLIKRLTQDKSIKVRRMAAAMLAMRMPEKRVGRALRRVLRDETDRKLRNFARWGLSLQAAEWKQKQLARLGDAS
jgi:HEAT repeat protein